ncbi:MAG: flagellar export chaperone FlgN [Bacillota bacterium]
MNNSFGKKELTPDKFYDWLEELLCRQGEIVKAMLKGTENQINALRDADSDALIKLAGEQSDLAGELARLEGIRYEAQADVVKGFGLKPDASLRDLLGRVPEKNRAGLTLLAKSLREDLRALREAIDICRVMTWRGLQFNTLLMREIGLIEDNTYGAEGEVGQAKPSQAIDSVV